MFRPKDKLFNLTTFEKRVLKLVSRLPEGKLTTYQALAQAAGKPQAARAVGNVLRKNPFFLKIPCHRVIKANGGLGGYQLGQIKKLTLLKEEGIKFRRGKKSVDLKDCLYKFSK